MFSLAVADSGFKLQPMEAGACIPDEAGTPLGGAVPSRTEAVLYYPRDYPRGLGRAELDSRRSRAESGLISRERSAV
jgi:hypothetical protein